MGYTVFILRLWGFWPTAYTRGPVHLDRSVTTTKPDDLTNRRGADGKRSPHDQRHRVQEPQFPPGGNPGSPGISLDSTDELVSAMQQGDPRVGRALYARYADRLFDLALVCTNDKDEAAHILSDVIVECSQVCLNVRTMSLTTWMYARLREHMMGLIGSRIAPDDRVINLDHRLDVTNAQDRSRLVAMALAGASERDQLMAHLVLRHKAALPDLSKIMGISEASCELLWSTTSATLRTQLSALFALSWLRDRPEHPIPVLETLTDLAAIWDGNYTPLVHREAVNRLGDHPDIQEWVITNLDDPLAALSQVPMESAPKSLQVGVYERLAMVWQLRGPVTVPPTAEPMTAEEAVVDDDDDSTIPPGKWPGDAIVAPAPKRSAQPRRKPWFKRVSRPALIGGVAAAGIGVGVVATLAYQSLSTPTPITATEAEVAELVPTLSKDASLNSDSKASPGRLTVPTGALPIESGTTTSMLLANTGGTALEWHLESVPDWVQPTLSSGSLAPGATTEVGLTLGKIVDSAEQNGQIDIHWDGIESGYSVVHVRAQAGQPPQVGEIQIAQQPPTCNESLNLSLTVEDSAGVKEVTVVGMAESGATYAESLTHANDQNLWEGVLGPITEAGNLRLSVKATDGQGNSIEANRGVVAIGSCDVTPS